MRHEAKIRKLLEQRNWSVTDLAREAELPQRTVDRYVKRMPDQVKVAITIARTLGVSVDWLFDDRKNWPPPVLKGMPADLKDPAVIQMIVAALAAQQRKDAGE